MIFTLGLPSGPFATVMRGLVGAPFESVALRTRRRRIARVVEHTDAARERPRPLDGGATQRAVAAHARARRVRHVGEREAWPLKMMLSVMNFSPSGTRKK